MAVDPVDRRRKCAASLVSYGRRAELVAGLVTDMGRAAVCRVVFMGTPRFALPSLQMLLNTCKVVGVVTQPERPAGRGRHPQPSPVHDLAMRHGLPVLTPVSLRESAVQVQIGTWRPNLIVVAALGLLLPQAMLDLPPAGCLNVHASLLPRWRGAAPIPAAILAGDTETGVTIMRMEAGLDTGPIISQSTIAIAPDDTQASLGERLSHVGAELLDVTIPAWLAGRAVAQAQDESKVTWAPPLEKQHGHINWNDPAEQIARRVRAFDPWPGTFTTWCGGQLKILSAEVVTQPVAGPAADLAAGTVIATPAGPVVVTGGGALRLTRVQPPGKRQMSGSDFARGARDFVGSQLA